MVYVYVCGGIQTFILKGRCKITFRNIWSSFKFPHNIPLFFPSSCAAQPHDSSQTSWKDFIFWHWPELFLLFTWLGLSAQRVCVYMWEYREWEEVVIEICGSDRSYIAPQFGQALFPPRLRRGSGENKQIREGKKKPIATRCCFWTKPYSRKEGFLKWQQTHVEMSARLKIIRCLHAVYSRCEEQIPTLW